MKTCIGKVIAIGMLAVFAQHAGAAEELLSPEKLASEAIRAACEPINDQAEKDDEQEGKPLSGLQYVCWLTQRVDDLGAGSRLDTTGVSHSIAVLQSLTSSWLAETAGEGISINRKFDRLPFGIYRHDALNLNGSADLHGQPGPLYSLLVAVVTQKCAGPYIASGLQYSYWTGWCAKTGNSGAKLAQQDYYYLFKNGSWAFVTGFEFACGTPDELAMPTLVRDIACEP